MEIPTKQFALVLLLLCSLAIAVPPTAPVTGIGVINNTKYDTTPNLGYKGYISAVAYYPNNTKASAQYCSISIYRWSANNSKFIPTYFSDTKQKCLEDQITALENPGYDCYKYTDGAGELYAYWVVDPTVYELGDIGKIELHCANATWEGNFTVFNYRPSDSFFGSIFLYLVNNPIAIFGLALSAFIGSILLVVILILPIIILRRLFAS